jgi:pimeloyl-ACP methyl ester carboxylesterase
MVVAYTRSGGGCKCMVVVGHSWGAVFLHRASRRPDKPACAQYIYVDPPGRQWLNPPGNGNNTADAINNAHDLGIMSDPNIVDWTDGHHLSNPLHDSFVADPDLTPEEERTRQQYIRDLETKVIAVARSCGSKPCEGSGCAR